MKKIIDTAYDYHANEPAKAMAYQQAAAGLYIHSLNAGIHMVFADDRYQNFTSDENDFLSKLDGATKSPECGNVTGTAALDLFRQQGHPIDASKLMDKIKGYDAIKQNALNTFNAAAINGKPASFYTLQGAGHSDQPAGNPVTFTQAGMNTVDMALAPAEASHVPLGSTSSDVLPQYLYSFRTTQGLSGQAAKAKYLDVTNVPTQNTPVPLSPSTPQQPTPEHIKTTAECVADLSPDLYDALTAPLQTPKPQSQQLLGKESTHPHVGYR